MGDGRRDSEEGFFYLYDLNNGVKVINHSQLLELSLIYISASVAQD